MNTAMVIAIIGIFAAFALQIIMCYKGHHISYVAVFASLLIIATSRLPLVETFTNGMSGVGSMVAIMMPLFLFGAILALVYVESGAAYSLADLMLSPFAKLSERAQRRAAVTVSILFGVLVCAAGINTLAIMITQLAINTAIFQRYNIPRKYLACVQIFGSTIAVGLPGVPGQFNVIGMSILGVGASVAPIPRLVGCIVMLVLGTLWLWHKVEKDVSRGEIFELGQMNIPNVIKDKRPAGWVALIPLVVIYVVFNWVIEEAWVSMAIGLVVAMGLLWRYIPHDQKDPSGKPMSRYRYAVDLWSRGAVLIPVMVIMNNLPAFVLEQAEAYQVLVGKIAGLPGPAVISYLICTLVLTGLGGNAGFTLGCQAALTHYAAAGLTSSAAIAINLMSSTVLDTLPTNLGIILLSAMSNTKMKDAYKPIFATTVVVTFISSVVTALLCLIPGLAA